jgi:hypothetical protein
MGLNSITSFSSSIFYHEQYAKQSKAKQSKAKQSKAKQSKAKQSKAKINNNRFVAIMIMIPIQFMYP